MPIAVPVQFNVPKLVAPEDNVTSIEPSVALQIVGSDTTVAITGEAVSVTVTGAVELQPILSA